MYIERKWAMPNKDTFRIKPIYDLINRHIYDYNKIIDPFSGNTPFKGVTITNDLNPDAKADYNLDALDFLKLVDGCDAVLFDPPYSPRQVSECYKSFGFSVGMETTQATFWSNLKKQISRIVVPGGKTISFGWNSGGIGKKYGFEIVEILLVAHGGWHNDTICTVEVKK